MAFVPASTRHLISNGLHVIAAVMVDRQAKASEGRLLVMDSLDLPEGKTVRIVTGELIVRMLDAASTIASASGRTDLHSHRV